VRRNRLCWVGHVAGIDEISVRIILVAIHIGKKPLGISGRIIFK
jgi:hypothetical protein